MEKNRDIAIQINGLKKRYRLGVIGGGTLQGDIQSWWARVRGKDDPNLKIGKKTHNKNETFMALNGIDLTVYKGERLGIIGHNGAGKSTLLKLLSRVTAPTEGEIKIDGRISSMLEVGTGFNDELTGRENIYLNGAILGMTTAEVDSKIEQIIEFSECSQFIDTPVKRYSSGMYVKLAFAVAAHLDSEILVMDEVLAVGDMAFQQKCLGKMSDVSTTEGKTVLYVSHNMNTIRQLCDRCIVMNHGKIIFNGDVEEAINMYLEGRFSEDRVFYDFSGHTIAEYCSGKAKIMSFEFKDADSLCFNANTQIKTAIHLKSETDISNLCIRYAITSANGTKIGTCITADGFSMKKNEDCEFELIMDASNLTIGRYIVTITMYETNEYGTQSFVDLIPDAFAFKIVSNPDSIKGFNWNASKLGSVVLPPLKVKH